MREDKNSFISICVVLAFYFHYLILTKVGRYYVHLCKKKLSELKKKKIIINIGNVVVMFIVNPIVTCILFDEDITDSCGC